MTNKRASFLLALSLSGAVGNAAAWVLFAGQGLLPLLFLFRICRKRAFSYEDALLPLLSLLAYFLLYWMINPGGMPAIFGYADPDFSRILLSSLFYSLLFGYLVLRILRMTFQADPAQCPRYLSRLLSALILFWIFRACGIRSGELIRALRSLPETIPVSFEIMGAGESLLLSGSSGITGFFLILQYLTDILPDLLNVGIAHLAISLLHAYHEDRYSEAAARAADRLAGACRTALIIVILTTILFNLLQLLFVNALLTASFRFSIPVLSAAFALGALLLCRSIRENQQLKADNDLFV